MIRLTTKPVAMLLMSTQLVVDTIVAAGFDCFELVLFALFQFQLHLRLQLLVVVLLIGVVLV